MPALQARAWHLTNHIQGHDETYVNSVRLVLENPPNSISYMRYGEDSGHIQAWVYVPKRTTKRALKKWMPDAELEVVSGDLHSNNDYKAKAATYKEYGRRPQQGCRTDILDVKKALDNVKTGETVEDLARDPVLFSPLSRMPKFANAYVNNLRRRAIQGDHTAPEVTFIHGPANSGKTRYVRDKEEPSHLYDVPADNGFKWFDGYAGEPAVLYDNLRPESFSSKESFLKALDRYPIQVAIKGGFTPFHPKRIYLTSTFPLEHLESCFAPNELRRRITSILCPEDLMSSN
jgi:TusA-related sulfurtransferase